MRSKTRRAVIVARSTVSQRAPTLTTVGQPIRGEASSLMIRTRQHGIEFTPASVNRMIALYDACHINEGGHDAEAFVGSPRERRCCGPALADKTDHGEVYRAVCNRMHQEDQRGGTAAVATVTGIAQANPSIRPVEITQAGQTDRSVLAAVLGGNMVVVSRGQGDVHVAAGWRRRFSMGKTTPGYGGTAYYMVGGVCKYAG